MNRAKYISERDIYVEVESLCSDTETGEFRYSLIYKNSYVLNHVHTEDVLEIMACFQHAVDVNEKGGQK